MSHARRMDRGKDDWEVVDALVVRGEHVTDVRTHAAGALEMNAHTCGLQNQPGPEPRARVRHAPAALHETRQDRHGPEDYRVDADGGDEKEDGAPPVERGERHSQIRRVAD